MTLSCTRCQAEDPAGTLGAPCSVPGCKGILRFAQVITVEEVAAYRAQTCEGEKVKQ